VTLFRVPPPRNFTIAATPNRGALVYPGNPLLTLVAVVGRCPTEPVAGLVMVGAELPVLPAAAAGNGGTRVGLGQVSSGQCCTGGAVEVVPVGTSTVHGMAVVGGALGCMVLGVGVGQMK
jgi:hypothetical protein